ncbi:MAG: S1C family serine protease [Alphaproteobacteria bacterium]
MADIKRANGHRLDGILPGIMPSVPGPRPTAENVGFDLEAALAAVRPLRARAPADGYTAASLGTEREGNAVLIDASGLLLTIGYLIVEATEIMIGGTDGKGIPAQAAGYDHETGFGLVRTVETLDVPPLAVATDVDGIVAGAKVVIVGQGGAEQALMGEVADRREFAGSWEYMLDSAIFTRPLHPRWSGAALLDRANGALIGIGSLYVQEIGGSGEIQPGNMFVPVDILAPIYDDLVRIGRPSRPARPWLGMQVTEALGHLVVAGVLDDGPADSVGVMPGDLVATIEGQEVETLPDMYRRIWSAGNAGTDIQVGLVRGPQMIDVIVHSADRQDFLHMPRRH